MNAPRSSPGAIPGDDDERAVGGQTSDSAELQELMSEIAGLRRALETRPTIDLAKGMVMQRYACTDVAAFGLLRRFSQEHNVKIRDLAAAIVARVDDAGPEAAPATVVPIADRLFQGPETDGVVTHVDGDSPSVDGAAPSPRADRVNGRVDGRATHHGRGTD